MPPEDTTPSVRSPLAPDSSKVDPTSPRSDFAVIVPAYDEVENVAPSQPSVVQYFGAAVLAVVREVAAVPQRGGLDRDDGQVGSHRVSTVRGRRPDTGGGIQR